MYCRSPEFDTFAERLGEAVVACFDDETIYRHAVTGGLYRNPSLHFFNKSNVHLIGVGPTLNANLPVDDLRHLEPIATGIKDCKKFHDFCVNVLPNYI